MGPIPRTTAAILVPWSTPSLSREPTICTDRLYEYFRNDALDADNALSAPGLHTLRANQFGAEVGGPIRRSKTFYFTGYEGQRRAESPIYSSFILGCIDTPNCMGPGTPSINQVKQQFGLQPEQLNSVLETDDYDKAIGKLTHNFSDRSILNVSYLFTNDRKGDIPTAAPGQGLPSTYRDNPVRDQTVYGNFLHIFGPRWTSESVLCLWRPRVSHDPERRGLRAHARCIRHTRLGRVHRQRFLLQRTAL